MTIDNVRGLTRVSDESLDVVTGGKDKAPMTASEQAVTWLKLIPAKICEGIGIAIGSIPAVVVTTLTTDRIKTALSEKKEKDATENDPSKKQKVN